MISTIFKICIHFHRMIVLYFRFSFFKSPCSPFMELYVFECHGLVVAYKNYLLGVGDVLILFAFCFLVRTTVRNSTDSTDLPSPENPIFLIFIAAFMSLS